MSDSILTSTKKVLGIVEADESFDDDILMHINSAFVTINQLGIGPEVGFMIEDATPTWDDLLAGDIRLNSIKSYIYVRVRLLFDPPQTSYLIEAMDKQRLEMEYRLGVYRESTGWTPPEEEEE